MKFAGLVFILFFYLYVPELIFLPVSLRLVFGVFGISLYLVRLINKYKNIKDEIQLNRDFFVFWIGTITMGFAALLVVVINESGDIKVVREILVRFSMLFGAAYFLIWYIKQLIPNSDYQIILKAFVSGFDHIKDITSNILDYFNQHDCPLDQIDIDTGMINHYAGCDIECGMRKLLQIEYMCDECVYEEKKLSRIENNDEYSERTYDPIVCEGDQLVHPPNFSVVGQSKVYFINIDKCNIKINH